MLMMLSPMAMALESESGFYYPAPPEEGYIVDEADILTAETKASLNEKLTLLEAETSTQMVIVTMADLQDFPIESVSLEIGREWGVGQEEYDNGLVFLIAPNERQARIEVGRGLEGAITDATSSMLLSQVVGPNFQAGDYDKGIVDTMYYLEGLARDEGFDISALESSSLSNDTIDIITFIATFGIFFVWIGLSLMSQSKSWWAGGVFGGILGAVLFGTFAAAGMAAVIGLFMDYIASTYFYKKIKWSSGGSGSGGSSGGFSSGGGGGGFSGGGGSFGGGGASGSW